MNNEVSGESGPLPSVTGLGVPPRHGGGGGGRHVAELDALGAGRGSLGQVGVGGGDGLGLLGPPGVRFPVKVGEQVQEDDDVADEEEGQGLGQLAVEHEQRAQVGQHDAELRQLDLGDVLLPPQVLLVLGPQGGDEVVGVQDHVDDGVEEADDDALFAGQVLQVAPGE